MYPAYTWTNSYPMHFSPNDDPRAKEIPIHMKVDPNTAPNSPYHQPWPYYPVPHDYHGCCNHSYFGGGPYSFRPPYPHYPPSPSTLHTYGLYPPYPGAYPAYSTPPPHYSFEQPRYDYDKNNHVPHHHQGDENKSRIVQEEPKVESKTSESLVPLFLKDSPYPIMWVPSPGNVNNELKAKENENKSRIVREEPKVDTKTSESLVPLFLKDSPYPIMWVPSPSNVNNDSKTKENENKSRIVREEPKVETKRSESSVPLFLKDSPYPIMWVPSHGNVNNESNAKENEKKSSMQREEPEVEKKTSESLVPLFLKDWPYPIMWVPSSRYKNEESKVMDKEKRSQDSASLKDAEPIRRDENGEGKHLPFPIFWLPSKNNEVGTETKDNNVDLVARKWLPDENKRQVSDGEAESEIRNKHVVQKVIPVKQVGANEETKSVETKMELVSVEKKDNAIEEGKASPKSSKLPPVCLRIDPLPRKKKTSRSPSPPGVKDRVKSSQPETHSPEISKKDEEQSEGKIKTDMVTTDANKVENNGLAAPCEDIPKDEKGKAEEKKNLSEQDAALMIQSAYRGFEVRKSQPLTKLRKIGEVTKQAVEIRNRIRDMESSSSNDKQKLIIGETIMSLLLKLDTIQGLHPIVRDIRKSVAKELVGLQEKLDSLTSKKSETPIVETVPSSTDGAIEEKSDQSNSNDAFVESGLGLSGNHGEVAKESHHEDDAEAYNTNLEPQLELRKEESVREPNNKQPVDAGIQQKFDQALSQFDSTNKAKDSVVNGGDIKPEQLVDHSTGELNNNKIQMSLETEKLVDNSDQEKSDHMQPESDSTCGDVGLDTTIVENHEVEAIESVDNNGEGARDTKTEELIEQNTEELDSVKHVETEQPLDDSIQEKSDAMQVKSGTIDETMKSDTDICEHHEVESVESYNDAAEVGDISQESTVELSNNLEIRETEQPVEQENLDQRQAQYESDIENVDSNMEDMESRDVSVMEMNDELSKEDAMEGIQEDLIVPTDEAPKADDVEILMEDIGEAPPNSPTESHVINDGDGKLVKNLGGVPSVSPMSGGDRTLMEENEKLRVAVEELLKAGNEQLGVIRELTGKVKDLEKKLSKKNKKIKVNKCRSRGLVVHDELSDCLV